MTENYNINIFGPLFVRIKLEQEDVEKILSLCKEKESFSQSLAGHFTTEYEIDKVAYAYHMQKYFKTFTRLYNKFYNRNMVHVAVASAWVNFMKANDYNPPHIHTKCDFSTALILKTPDGLDKECKDLQEKANVNQNLPGNLCFEHGLNNFFNNTSYFFKPEVGDLYLFPYWLIHWVNPFKCTGERVSVSSNLILQHEHDV